MLKRVGSGRNGTGILQPRPQDSSHKNGSYFLFKQKKQAEADFTVSRTSLIRTPKGLSKVSVLERCPYKRGHYDDVTFMTPLAVLSV